MLHVMHDSIIDFSVILGIFLRAAGIIQCVVEFFWQFLGKVDGNERLWQIHSIELCAQGVDDLLPVDMCCQTATLGKTNGMFGVELSRWLSAGHALRNWRILTRLMAQRCGSQAT